MTFVLEGWEGKEGKEKGREGKVAERCEGMECFVGELVLLVGLSWR